MPIHTDTLELDINVAPSRLWKAVVEAPKLALKLLPAVFQSFEVVKGDGGVGTVRKVTIKDPQGTLHSNQEVVDAVDDNTHTLKWHVEEGDIKKLFRSVNSTLTILPGTDAGKSKLQYITEVEPVAELPPAAVNEGHKQIFAALAKALEAHLVANEAEY